MIRQNSAKAIVLVLVLIFSLIQVTFLHSYYTPTGRGSTVLKDAIPLLIQSGHDLQPDEVALLNTLGLLTTVAGPVGVLHADPTLLDRIGQLPTSMRVKRARLLSVYLDSSIPDVGANAVWQEIKDPYGRNVTGAGVIIGIVDTGIDTTHPDFAFSNGTTKILYVWDQTAPGRPPSGFDYGYECNSIDIQYKTCPEIDTFGHGTHVAGIAASSGHATGKYAGVAPDARIIFVKSGTPVCGGASWNFYDYQILDGVNYIVEKAAQLKMRAVISLSMGGNIGAHDGTAPLELGLDAFVKAGTPIVVAGGNEAGDDAHIRGQLSKDDNATINVQVRATTTDLQLDFWYSPQDQFDATLVAPDGEIFSVSTTSSGTRNSYGNVTTLASSSTLSKEIYMEVNATHSLSTEIWKVLLKATNAAAKTGVWDAWVDTETCVYPGAKFLSGSGYDIDSNDTIGIPGTARYVVTVGAYVTKPFWIVNGTVYGRKDLPVGAIASFSSLGPTRDGRIKPDVVAPGMFIASARSAAIQKSQGDPDGFHRVLAGTSMATPHVAGIVALMLQYYPYLQATAVSQILRETARVDQFTGLISVGSPLWGYGKVDSRTATGFFRLTLISQGLPPGIKIPIRIDNSNSIAITANSWEYVYFLKGSKHLVTVGTTLQNGTGTRYLLPDGSLNLTASSIKLLNYTVQYLLTVNSRFGPVTGAGWYDANTTAKITVPTRANADGLLSMIGGEYVLGYFVTDEARPVSALVVMYRPITVTAVYNLTFPLQTYVELGTLILVIVLFVITIEGRRKKPATSS